MCIVPVGPLCLSIFRTPFRFPRLRIYRQTSLCPILSLCWVVAELGSLAFLLVCEPNTIFHWAMRCCSWLRVMRVQPGHICGMMLCLCSRNVLRSRLIPFFIYTSHCLSKEETNNFITMTLVRNSEEFLGDKNILTRKWITLRYHYPGTFFFFSFPFLLFPFPIFRGIVNKINFRHSWLLSAHNFPSLLLCLFFPKCHIDFSY